MPPQARRSGRGAWSCRLAQRQALRLLDHGRQPTQRDAERLAPLAVAREAELDLKRTQLAVNRATAGGQVGRQETGWSPSPG